MRVSRGKGGWGGNFRARDNIMVEAGASDYSGGGDGDLIHILLQLKQGYSICIMYGISTVQREEHDNL